MENAWKLIKVYVGMYLHVLHKRGIDMVNIYINTLVLEQNMCVDVYLSIICDCM